MKRRYLALLPMVLAAALPAWAAEMLVIGSVNSDISAGDIVDSAMPLRLAAGAQLTLVAEDGTAVTLEGPYEGPPRAEAPEPAAERTLLRALGTLFAAGSGGRGTTKGATRGGAGGAVTSGDPWLIDAASGGDGCALAGGAITLWRATSDTSSALKLTHKESRASADLEWPAGAATIGWPAAVPIENGADYLLRPKAVLVARKMTLHLVPGDLPSDAHRAAWMAEAGCTSQAMILISQMR